VILCCTDGRSTSFSTTGSSSVLLASVASVLGMEFVEHYICYYLMLLYLACTFLLFLFVAKLHTLDFAGDNTQFNIMERDAILFWLKAN
jgi:hypothetical protein